MKRFAMSGLCVLAIAAAAALAQPPAEGPDDRGPGPRRGERRGPPPSPVVEALDADGNHEISAEEIANAAEALKKLDTDGDGKLTPQEFQPRPPRDRLGRPGGDRPDGDRPEGDRPDGRPRFRRGDGDGPGPRGPGGPFGRGPDGPPGPPNPERFVEHALTFDADDDGKLDRDELLKFAQEMTDRRRRFGGPGPRGPEDDPDAPPPDDRDE